MTPPKSRFLIPALAASLAALGATARSDEAPRGSVLTLRNTPLFRLDGEALVASRTVPAATELAVDAARPDRVDGSGTVYRPVRSGADGPGWVRRADLMAVPAFRRREGEVPPLIAEQPVASQRAWELVRSAIEEDARLGTNSHQPYLARAELWALAGGYDEAIADLLEATNRVRRRPVTNAEQIELLRRLEELLALRVQAPRPPYRGDAMAHFQRGWQAYHDDRLDEALRHFDRAVQIDPEDKVLWYYRALTHKRLGQDQAAERDITVAVYLERRDTPPNPTRRWEDHPAGWKHWTRHFARVQGPLRLWMEDHRSGVASGS